MTDALDRACAGMFASHHLDWNRMAPEGKQWWRGFVVEALRVMADDLRAQTATWHAEYEAYARDGEVLAACADAIIDSYVGSES